MKKLNKTQKIVLSKMENAIEEKLLGSKVDVNYFILLESYKWLQNKA